MVPYVADEEIGSPAYSKAVGSKGAWIDHRLQLVLQHTDDVFDAIHWCPHL